MQATFYSDDSLTVSYVPNASFDFIPYNLCVVFVLVSQWDFCLGRYHMNLFQQTNVTACEIWLHFVDQTELGSRMSSLEASAAPLPPAKLWKWLITWDEALLKQQRKRRANHSGETRQSHLFTWLTAKKYSDKSFGWIYSLLFLQMAVQNKILVHFSK